MNSIEIARLAGVSRSTVSRVINNYPNVPEETRQKVMEIVKKYNYVPHASARMLAGKSSRIIGLIIIDTKEGNTDKVHGSSYFSQFTSLVIDYANRLGYNVLVSIVSDADGYNNIKDIFYNKTISGGIFIGGMNNHPEIREIISYGCSTAIIGQDIKGPDNIFKKAIIINPDNYYGAYNAVKYLIDAGHRQIVHLCGDMEQISAVERFEGYKRALLDSGLMVSDKLIAQGNFTEESGYVAVRNLLKEFKPDAIFCSNDHMAIGAMRAVEEQGYDVPENLSIMGFDDIEVARYTKPALTTVKISLAQIATLAVEGLIDGIENGHNVSSYCRVPVDLVIRESVTNRNKR